MTREHASKGFKAVTNTSATAANFYGFTVISDAVINTAVAPTAGNPEGAYSPDYAGVAGNTLPAGGYYPIRGSNITLTSGKIVLWLE
jgi:hypothetical protein